MTATKIIQGLYDIGSRRYGVSLRFYSALDLLTNWDLWLGPLRISAVLLRHHLLVTLDLREAHPAIRCWCFGWTAGRFYPGTLMWRRRYYGRDS